MLKYIKDNWDGWPLHSLIAGLLMHPVITNQYPTLMFILHLVFWPSREAWQHDGFRNIFTLHRMLEWGAPIVTAGVILGFLSW